MPTPGSSRPELEHCRYDAFAGAGCGAVTSPTPVGRMTATARLSMVLHVDETQVVARSRRPAGPILVRPDPAALSHQLLDCRPSRDRGHRFPVDVIPLQSERLPKPETSGNEQHDAVPRRRGRLLGSWTADPPSPPVHDEQEYHRRQQLTDGTERPRSAGALSARFCYSYEPVGLCGG
jgi:hypothetical protein